MAGGTVVLVTKETLGTVAQTDREFGLQMMDKLLVCHGSKVLLGLRLLQGLGVRLVACQSCLEHYGLAGEVAAGEIGNMRQIVDLMLAAGKVVTV